MRTTLNIDRRLHGRLKKIATSQRRSLSSVVEDALRQWLRSRVEKALPQLPSFNGGRMLVDVANREELYDLLDATDPVIARLRRRGGR